MSPKPRTLPRACYRERAVVPRDAVIPSGLATLRRATNADPVTVETTHPAPRGTFAVCDRGERDPDGGPHTSGCYAHAGPCEPCDCGKEHAIVECPRAQVAVMAEQLEDEADAGEWEGDAC